MAVGTPALVGGQHVVIRLEMSPHASAVLFVSLSFAYRQAGCGVSTLSPAAQKQYAGGCVEYIWSGLGKQLQRTAGVAEAELEGDSSQPAAAAAGDSSSSSSKQVYSQLMREGVEMDLPADAGGRLRMLWEEFGVCLFTAINFNGAKSKSWPAH
jgi:hypothetical protein